MSKIGTKMGIFFLLVSSGLDSGVESGSAMVGLEDTDSDSLLSGSELEDELEELLETEEELLEGGTQVELLEGGVTVAPSPLLTALEVMT